MMARWIRRIARRLLPKSSRVLQLGSSWFRSRQGALVRNPLYGKDEISLLACDIGLNLTACNNVILVDMWWNPALEVRIRWPSVPWLCLMLLLFFRTKLSTDLIVLDKHAMWIYSSSRLTAPWKTEFSSYVFSSTFADMLILFCF